MRVQPIRNYLLDSHSDIVLCLTDCLIRCNFCLLCVTGGQCVGVGSAVH